MAATRHEDTHWVVRHLPRRPVTGPALSEGDGELMEAHGGYWSRLASTPGVVVVLGPAGPPGAFGLVVFTAESEAAARAIVGADPAVVGGLIDPELSPMPVTVLGA